MATDPLTVEYEQNQPSALELEALIDAEAEQEKVAIDDEISAVKLEAQIEADFAQTQPEVPLEDDGWANNTWEVLGSAVEQAGEQMLRTVGDLTTFEGDETRFTVGGLPSLPLRGTGLRFAAADPELRANGIPLPFTDKRLHLLTSSDWDELSLNYEIATGKVPMNLSGIDFPDVDRPDSMAGQMVSGFAQWLIVFVATRKAMRTGNIASATIADFAAFDPHEARLSNLARDWGKDNPVFDNAFTEFMASDPTDTAVDGRLKGAVEGLLIAGAITGTAKAIMGGFRWQRAYRGAKAVRTERTLKDAKVLETEAAPIADDFDNLKIDDDGKSVLVTAQRVEPRKVFDDTPVDDVTPIDPNTGLELDQSGLIELNRRGGETIQIVNSVVEDTQRGLGKGKKLYAEAKRIADEEGLALTSDSSVSESAGRIWDSMAKAGDDIWDMRKMDPENITTHTNPDGSLQYVSNNGQPIFRRVARAADDARAKTTADDAAGAAKEPTQTFGEVAARRLKAAVTGDPTKLRAIKAALESGDMHTVNELIDFNHSTVDWEGLGKQLGEDESVAEFISIINTFSTVFEAEMKSAKGLVTLAETAAKAVGTTADDVLKLGVDVTGGKGIAARMAGADSFLYQSTQELRRLAKVAGASNSDKDMIAFYRQMDLHATLQATIGGSKSEIARALRQMQSINTLGIDDFKEFDELMRTKKGMNGDQRRQLAQKIADLKDLNKINQLTRRTRYQTIRDIWIEVFVNGLLSAISTLNLNNASNTLKLIEGITERYMAATVGGAKNLGRRALRKQTKEAISFGEANAYVYGTIQGLDSALRLPFAKLLKGDLKSITTEDFGSVYTAARTETPQLDTRMRADIDTRRAISVEDTSERTLLQSLRKMDLSGTDWNAKAINNLGRLVRMPGRMILTSDEFFKQITYNQHLAARAYKDGNAIALAKGYKGKKRLATIERTHRNYKEFPPDDVRFEAMDHARYQTFQSDLKPDSLARSVETVINRYPEIKFIIPFYRTPVNIIKQTVMERTPIGLIKGHKSELFRRIAAGGPEGDIALARLATGSAFLGWAMMMASSGKITGGGLSTTNRPNTQQMSDIPPYSVEYRGTHYQFNRLEPLGMLLGLGADLQNAAAWYIDEDDVAMSEAMSLALTVITTNITDKTWFKGVAELVAAIEQPLRYGETYFKKQTKTMLTPFSSLLRRINTDHDEISRETWTWMDHFKADVPGFSDDLPVRYDLLGKPKYKRDYLGPAWASPVASGVERDDPVYKEIARLAFDYSNPAKDLFGVGKRVDSQVYSDVMELKGTVRIGGKTLHEALDITFESGFYLDMLSDEGKADVAKGLISSYLRAAKGKYLQENPDYLFSVKEGKQAQWNLLLQQ